jgi:catechol 2,3-dioxygenase-like lactoylglutathione lyase family enzyme
MTRKTRLLLVGADQCSWQEWKTAECAAVYDPYGFDVSGMGVEVLSEPRFDPNRFDGVVFNIPNYKKAAVPLVCCALEAGPRQVLLLFRKGASTAIPSPHDGDGELHLAFAISAGELAAWEAWLAENGIAVEEKRGWELGGQSLYFRDPDRHLLELATPGVWSIY